MMACGIEPAFALFASARRAFALSCFGEARLRGIPARAMGPFQEIPVRGDATEPSGRVDRQHRHPVLRQQGLERDLHGRGLVQPDGIAGGERAHRVAQEGVLELAELRPQRLRVLVMELGRRLRLRHRLPA